MFQNRKAGLRVSEMTKLSREAKHKAIIVIILILTAMTLRIINKVFTLDRTFNIIIDLLRSSIYIGLFSAWGISLRRRIIQVEVRRYFSAISFMMVFWLLIRTVKYQFFTDTHVGRFCWYLYYLPMLFIPVLVLFVALSLDKPENYRLPKWTNYLLGVSGILFLLVITNDFHQLAFKFYNGILFYENSNYAYKIVYFISMGWMAICALTAFIVMILKSRVSKGQKRIYLPSIPLFLQAIYVILYVSVHDFIRIVLGDMTVTNCLLVAASIEGCIICGLIQSNTRYSDLFRLSGIGAKIVDENYELILSSKDTTPISKEIMSQTETAPVILDGNIRISGAPIRGGHVLWTDDVSELIAVLDELEEKQEELKKAHSILYENYKTEQQIRQLVEKNRLYDKLHRQTVAQITLLGNLLTQFEEAENEKERKTVLQEMIVVGVYLKRRSNLIFISEQSQMLHPREISLCFDETIENLELSGITCGYYMGLTKELPVTIAMALYDFYERIIEATYDSLNSILIRIYENDTHISISIDVSCDCDLSYLQSETISVISNGNREYSILMRILKEGEAK